MGFGTDSPGGGGGGGGEFNHTYTILSRPNQKINGGLVGIPYLAVIPCLSVLLDGSEKAKWLR